jgi:hypothetical protein
MIGFALAGIALVAVVVLSVLASKKSKQASEAREMLEQQLEAANERSRKFEARASEVELRANEIEARANEESSRASKLEKDLAEAMARKDEKAMAKIMWALELERSHRQWRDVVLPTEPLQTFEGSSGSQLAYALSQEVERLREEVGVAIRFDGGFDIVLDPETALGALRIGEELLAMAAKRADEVDVTLEQTGGEPYGPFIATVLNCRGWEEGPDPVVSELADTVEKMAERLAGSVRWDRSSTSDLTVTVMLPASIPETLDLASAERSSAVPTSN